MLEERLAPVIQVYSGLEFMTTGTFNTNNDAVTTSSPVDVGVNPAQGSSFTPLVALNSGVQFTLTDATGTFTTNGAVSAYAGGLTVPLLDAHLHTFQAPDLLGSGFFNLASDDTNAADLAVAGGNLAVTGLHFAPQELDVQGSLSLPNFAGLSLAVQDSNYVALNSSGIQLTGLDIDLAGPATFTVDGLQITAQNLQVHYASANAEFDLSGSVSVTAAGNTLGLTLGSSSAPGLVIVDGDLQSLQATITPPTGDSSTPFEVGDLSFGLTSATLSYDSTTGTFGIGAAASFSLDGNTVDVMLGSGGMPGIVIQNGALVSLDAAVTSDIDIGDLTFKTENLEVEYTAGADLTITGQASLEYEDQSITVTLGAADAGGMMQPGIVVDTGSGQLVSLDAAINSDIAIGGLTFKAEDLSIHYAPADTDATITGKASFELDVADQMESVEITLGSTDSGGVMHPGIEINANTGNLDSLDAVVDSDLEIAGADIAAKDLGVQYQSADGSFIISGGASFALDGNTVSIMLGGTFSQGLVIQGGQLQRLQAAVSGEIDLLGIQITANNLTVAYVAANGSTPQELALFGSVSVSTSFLHFATTLGNEQNPGILVAGGQLQSLDITVDGGFSLFGIDVAANGLTIQYSSAANQLELSGGIMLEFTSAFQVAASISQGGLIINTSTGALSIPSSGLQITASATLGPFSIQNLMISFSNGPGGVNFSASGAVDLPGGIDVDLTQLVVQNGQLDDIGLTVNAPIPIGDTGFYLDSLSGDLQNLNNPSQLTVMAGATISFGSKIAIPNLGPIFGGGDFYLVEASGSITVSATELDLSGQVSLLGGLLGQGSASIDLNWATGVYMVSGNFSMFDDIINFGGSLTITNQGDITLLAMASVNVPPQIPFIGGDSLGSINFYLQYRPGQDLTQSYVAAWTSVDLFVFSFTIGFKVDFDGDFNIINGNDVAALTAAAQSTQSGPYVYMQNLYNLSQPVAGSQPVGIQVTATSPIFDGAYPLTVDSDTVTAYFAGAAGNRIFSTYQLSHPYLIMSSLSFTVTVSQNTDSGTPTGGVFAGTGSFDAHGKFSFMPSGNTFLVPTGGTLTSGGELLLDWPGDPGVTTINANYDAAAAYFELLQQTQSGSPYPLATYTIDPASNDSGDQVQTAAAAEGVVTDSGLSGAYSGREGGGVQTVFHLLHGAADPRTVTFTVYLNGTELGTGYFDANQNLHFTPYGTPSLVPSGGSVGANLSGVGLVTLFWPKAFSGQVTATITYGAIGNRVIDFQLSNQSAPGRIPGKYLIELISPTQLGSYQIPAFSETDQYQTPTVSFASGSPSVNMSNVLTGTLLANAYTPAAQQSGDISATVSLYYSTTDDTKNGKLIDTFDYSSFTNNGSSSPRSYNFTWDGFQNLPAGSYYIYAVISDSSNPSAQNPAIAPNQPQYSAIAGPFTTVGPIPALSGPSFLALSSQGTSGAQGIFSATAGTALGLKTSFVNPVTVTLSLSQGTGLSGGGNLIVAGGSPTTSFTHTYASAAAATMALDGLQFVADKTFTGATTLTYTVTTTINGMLYSATQNIPLLSPNTHLVVTQSVNTSTMTDPHDYILTVTITNPGGPDGQDGTNVLVKNHLTPGLTVLSASASQGSFDPTTGLWTVGSLPITGANTATLTLMLQADASTQGKSLSNTASASSDLFNYPASDAENTVPIRRPNPIVIPVTNLNDNGAGSLRDALTAAQNGDTIQLSSSLADGTIVLTSGPLLINQDLSILAPSISTGAPSVTISGNHASRVFDIEGGANGISLTLQNLDIENGLAGDQAANVADAGAGLLINDLAGGTITLENLLIGNNVVQVGAGLNALGGGIALFGSNATTLVLTNTTLTANQAVGGQGGNGLGGGFYVSGGNVSLNGDTLANNQANGSNGLGGGLYVNGGTVSLTDDTLANNQANGGSGSGMGGGVYANGGSVILGNDTLANNLASAGGDVYVAEFAQNSGTTSIVEAFDSIFANPGATFTAPDFSGTLVYSDHNLIDNTTGSTGFSTANGDLLNVNADLAPLGNYGGPTQTMPPLPGSPVIGAGDTAVTETQAISGLVSWWRGYGNAQDSAGSNDGTASANVRYFPGQGGLAFQLNGTDAQVTVPDNASLDSPIFSVGGWYNLSKAPASGSEYYLASKYDGNYHGWILRINSNLVPTLSILASPSANANATSSTSLSLNTWHYLSATFDGTTATLYVDGVAVASTTLPGGYAPSATPLVIGAASWFSGGYTAGSVNNFAYYNATLSPAQESLLARPPVAAIGSPLSITQTPAIPGLVSWWRGNGSAQDSTGNNNGTISGGVGYAPGVSGLAFQLDGSTGYIQTGPNPADLSINDALTISAWVDPTVYKNDNVIIDKTQTGDAANYRFGIHGNGQLFFWNGSQAVFSNATIPLNTFTQVAFTLNGSTNTLSFYINGQLDSTWTIGFGALNTAAVTIGRDLPGRFFQGLLDEVTVYHAVLTSSQIALLARPPVAAAATPVNAAYLVDWYQAQGNAQDSAGNNNGTTLGNVAYAPGVSGLAFSLNGTNAYVQLGPQPFGASDFSVNFWLQTSNPGFQSVLGNRVSVGHGNFFQLRMNNGHLTVELDQDASGTNYVAITSSRLLDDGLFHQVTVTRSGTTVSLYIDGVLDSSATSAGVTNISSTNPFILGAEPQVGVVPFFNGLIGGVQIYKTNLTPAQIELLYYNPNGETTDQRGYALRAGANAVDIGAAEYQYDLSITGSVPASVPAGGTITDTFTITNNGPDAVNGVNLLAILPAGLTLLSTPPTPVNLAAGSSATFTLMVKVSSTFAPGTLSLTGTALSTAFDNDLNNNSVELTTSVVT
jgi:uncharacterized repeat protein (TIGR01451 family)